MRISNFFYFMARASRDGEAVGRSIVTGSPRPLIVRIANKLLGRFVISRLWFK